MFVMIRTQGLQFAVCVGPIGSELFPNWEREWQALANCVANGDVSQSVLDEIWLSSLPYQHPEDFLFAVLKKGIKVPKLEAQKN
jgi:hypothetical protein